MRPVSLGGGEGVCFLPSGSVMGDLRPLPAAFWKKGKPHLVTLISSL